MNITYRRLVEFINDGSQYLRVHPENTKLSYALTKTLKKAQRAYEGYADKLEDLRIKNCLTGDKDVILRDDRGNYQFTKEGLTAFNKEQRALVDTETQLETHVTTELPEGLEERFKEAFDGIVL